MKVMGDSWYKESEIIGNNKAEYGESRVCIVKKEKAECGEEKEEASDNV